MGALVLTCIYAGGCITSLASYAAMVLLRRRWGASAPTIGGFGLSFSFMVLMLVLGWCHCFPLLVLIPLCDPERVILILCMMMFIVKMLIFRILFAKKIEKEKKKN